MLLHMVTCRSVIRIVQFSGKLSGLVVSNVSRSESLLWRGQRTIHMAALLCSENISNSTDTAAISDVFETSSHAKWATDASFLSDLPPQGDLASLGLGGYSPVGILQTSLDWLHSHTGLPWWGAIIASTLLLRLALFPLAIKLQVNAVNLNNIRPEMEKIMAKIKGHQQTGNTTMAAQESARLMMLYKKHNCNPLKMMVMPFVQVLRRLMDRWVIQVDESIYRCMDNELLPIFISFFIALRQMAAAPIETMKVGGMLWFTDLTLPDPYYLLPVAACLTFMANIEMGGEAGVTSPQVEKMKTVFRAMAIILIPVTATFPSGLFMYWITSSLFSMGQILILKVPSIRSALGIPKLIKHETTSGTGGAPQEGVLKKLKESYRSASMIDEAKRKEAVAKKNYNKQLKDKSPKLYDKPPHKRD